MQGELSIRMQVEIPAQKIINMIVLDNEANEEQIRQGIEAAISKMDLRQMAEEAFYTSFKDVLRNTFHEWEFRKRIEQQIREKTLAIVDAFIAEKEGAIQQAVDLILKKP